MQCKKCKGTGTVPAHGDPAAHAGGKWKACPACKGKGATNKDNKHTCPQGWNEVTV